MDSIAERSVPVNPQILAAIKNYLRLSVAGLSRKSALRFKHTALSDIAAAGSQSLYWQCAAADPGADDDVRAAAARMMEGSA
jgi:hypothetical protein